VVVRGFEASALVIATDVRTNKVIHIRKAAKPIVQLLWLFTGARIQYRITGWVKIVDNQVRMDVATLLQRDVVIEGSLCPGVVR